MNKFTGAANKIPANLRKPSAWALGLGVLLALAGCEDRVAGSSVTTGNPTEIQVSFTGENGPVALTGKVEIYGATQIPVPGFRPEPLARYNVNGKSAFTLNAGHFESIADSMWAQGSLAGDSLARFNLIITGADKGAIVNDLVFRLNDDKFSLKEGSWTAGTNGAALVKANVSTLSTFKASMNTADLSLNKHNYLFLFGTGYFAEGDENGTFVFSGMPSGSYRPAFFAIPTKDSQAMSPQDSVNIYSLDKPLETGDNAVTRGSIETRIPIPEELRKP